MQSGIYGERFSKAYDSVYGNISYDRYADFIVLCAERYLHRKAQELSILDVACGTGKLVSCLSQRFFTVEGVDGSADMVRHAQKQFPNIPFSVQEFETLNMGHPYDMVVSTFDSINYLLDETALQRGFDRIRNHLKVDSLFVFDFNTEKRNLNGVVEQSGFLYDNKTENGIWTVTISRKDGADFREVHRERLYSLKEMFSVLHASGFAVEDLFGQTFEKADKPEQLERLIVSCRISSHM